MTIAVDEPDALSELRTTRLQADALARGPRAWPEWNSQRCGGGLRIDSGFHRYRGDLNGVPCRGARRCPGAVIYEYVTADRNVVILVQANPRCCENTGTAALRDLVEVARLQLQIVAALGPR